MLPETSDKNAAEFMVEEREGDENEEQQPGRRVDPQGTWGMKFPSRWPCLRGTSHPCPSSGCVRGHAGPATGLESGGLRDQGPNFSQLEKPFGRHILEMLLPGRAWAGHGEADTFPSSSKAHACQRPNPLPSTAPSPVRSQNIENVPNTSQESRQAAAQTPPEHNSVCEVSNSGIV